MNRVVKLSFLGLAAVVSGVVAQAANYTNNTSGNWSAPGSWFGSAGASAPDTVIVFNPSGTDNSTNNIGAFLLNQMWVATNQTVTLSASGGSSLLFTNNTTTMPVITNANAGTFTLNTPFTLGTNLTIGVGNSSGNITINSNITSIAGPNTLTKTGPGLVTLTGTNTYAGATAISAGTLTVNGGQITNSPYLTMNGSGAGFIITNGGSLFNTNVPVVDRGGLYIGASSGNKTNQVLVTGVNSLWNAGLQSLFFLGTSNTLTIANSGIVTNVGRFYYGNYVAGNSVIITNGGKFYTASTAFLGEYVGTKNNSVYVSDNGSLWNLGNNPLYIGDRGNGNSLTVDNLGMVTNVSTINVGTSSGGNSSTNNSIVITNGGQLFSTGASTIGANGSGNSVNSNYVNVAGGGARWDIGAATLAIGTTATTGNWMNVASGGVLTNGNVLLGGVGSTLNLGGDAYLSKVNLASNDAQVVFTGGTLHATANGTLLYGAGFGTINSSATIDARYAVTNTAPLTGAGSLIKTGVSNLVLSANNTYRGVTTVNQGVLMLSATGSISNSAQIVVSSNSTLDVSLVAGFTVASNQVLTGSGTVTGGVTVASGGILGAGDTGSAPGTLTINGGLTLAPGAVLNVDYTAFSSDGFQVNGAFSVAGTNTVILNSIGGALPPARFTVFTFNSGTAPDISGWAVQAPGITNKATLVATKTGIYVNIAQPTLIVVW